MKKKLKVLLLFDCPYETQRGYNYEEELKDDESWYTENDVYRALLELGYEVSLLGLHDNIQPLLDELKNNRPDVIFNLVEVFNQQARLDKNVAAIFELFGVPYTGASSEALMICNDKALSKKILRFHRVRVPRFHVFYRQYRVWLPRLVKLPVVIKPLCDEASRGISQASVVDNPQAFLERVKFIHENLGMDAIAEEYIEGRELYATILGNKRIKLLPLREMNFGQFPEDEPRIATYKAKWDEKYRARWGIKSNYTAKLPNGLEKHIEEVCKRAYRALNMRSYARFDIRVTAAHNVYILEANANPCIAKSDEVAQSAQKVGVAYVKLIQKIVHLALEKNVA